MSDIKTAKVKMYNASLKAGFLDYEIEDEDVILAEEAVGSLNLKNGDMVRFKVVKKGNRHYATNVELT
ncbi:cold shock domain-containing protein [Pseudomonas sp. CM25]|uniref:cold shock domain-containing protein n=1 Tax=Pseudomonas sp. CM25 TaxID=2738448 RepID=UPI001555AEAB|nr:cold shock domain-containing protein [Pseudomonas sp. CM25]NQD59019.1 cold shock domain-containing protein [Pseudomonas sp. CM25]